ncbi:unnamed protein product [Brassicogethes aeneus]|uniref:EF-hand domain-containing protein n=1 Tax=Brassicogethes aeneus TaxID=1431903 RepID=A0A9P0ATT5_BRAAE|nr:unnamed protein product [Brassicogethes aeneus]
MPKFGESDILEFQDAFDLFDKDEDGRLNLKEMDKALKAIGYIFSANELEVMFKEEDPDGTNIIDFEAFVRIIENNAEEKNLYEEIVAAFRVFDKAGNNVLTVREIKEIMTAYGDPLDPEELKLFIKDADPKKTGYVLYAELAEKIARKLYVKPKKAKKPKLREKLRKQKELEEKQKEEQNKEERLERIKSTLDGTKSKTEV